MDQKMIWGSGFAGDLQIYRQKLQIGSTFSQKSQNCVLLQDYPNVQHRVTYCHVFHKSNIGFFLEPRVLKIYRADHHFSSMYL